MRADSYSNLINKCLRRSTEWFQRARWAAFRRHVVVVVGVSPPISALPLGRRQIQELNKYDVAVQRLIGISQPKNDKVLTQAPPITRHEPLDILPERSGDTESSLYIPSGGIGGKLKDLLEG